MAGNLRFDVSATNSATGEFTAVAAELDKLARQLKDVDGKTARVKAEVAVSGAAALTELGAQLKALPNTTKSTVNVDVDKDASTRLASIGSAITNVGSVSSNAVAGISRFREAAKVLVDPSSLPIVERATDFIDNKFRRAVELATPAVDKLKTVLTGLRTGLLGLSAAGGAVQLIGSVGTSVAQLTGIVALAPAVMLGAAAGVATLKTAFAGFGDAVKADTPKKWAEATKDMAPAAVAAASAVRSLQTEFKGVQQVVQTNFFTGIADQIKSLGATYIPVLKTGLGSIATGFGDMARAALEAVQSTTAVGQVRTILDATGHSVQNMAPALANVVAGFLQLGAAGAQWLPAIGTAIAGLTEKFHAWTILITSDGSFNRWVQNGLTALGQLMTIIGNVIAIGGKLFSALNSGGVGFLATLASLTTQLRTFLDSAQGGTALQSLATALQAAGDAGQRVLAAVLQQLGPLLSALAPVAAALASAIADHLVTAINILGPLLTSLAQSLAQHPALLQAVASAAAAVAIGFGPVTAVLGPLITLLQGLVIARVAGLALAQLGLDGTVAGRVLMALVSPMALLREAAPLLAQGFGMLVAQLGIMAGPVGVLVVAFVALYTTSSQFRDAVNALAGVIGGLLLQTLQQAGQVMAGVITIFQSLGQAVATALSGLTSFASQVASAFGPVGQVVGDVLTGIFNHLGLLPGAILAAVTAFMTLSRIAPIFTTMSTAVAGFAARMTAFQSSSAIASASTTALGTAAGGLSTVLTKLGSALPLIGVALVGMGLAVQALSVDFDGLVQQVSTGAISLQAAVNQAVQQSQSGFLGFLNGLDQMVTGFDHAKMAAAEMRQKFDEYRASLGPMAQLQLDVTTAQSALNDAVVQFGAGSSQAKSAAASLATAQETLKTAQQGAADAAKTHDQALKDLADQMASQVSTALAYEQAVRRTAEAQEAANKALADAGPKSKAYQDAVVQLETAMSSQADAARRSAEAVGGTTAGVQAYNTEILRSADLSTQAGRDAFGQLASHLDSAGLAALSATARMSGLRTEVMTLPDGRTVTVVVAADQGKLPEVKQAAEDFAAKKYVGTVTINGESTGLRDEVTKSVTLVNGTKASIQMSADGTPALLAVGQTKYTIDSTTGTLQVLGNVAPGEASLNGFKVKVDTSTGQMTITANDGPANATTDAAKNRMDTSIGTMTLDGNPTLVNGKITASVTLADGSKGTITIDGQPDPATGKITATVTKADGSKGTITIDGNGQPAADAIGRITGAYYTATIHLTVDQSAVAAGIAKARVGGLAGGGVVGYSGGGVVAPIHAAGGYILSGYSPGRDSVPALLSRGESVLVPELTRALGAGRIMAANSEASGGRQGSAIGNLAGMIDGKLGRGTPMAVMGIRDTGNGNAQAATYAAGLTAVAGQVGQLRGDVQALGGAIRSARPITVEDRSGNPAETARAAALALRLA